MNAYLSIVGHHTDQEAFALVLTTLNIYRCYSSAPWTAGATVASNQHLAAPITPPDFPSASGGCAVVPTAACARLRVSAGEARARVIIKAKRLME